MPTYVFKCANSHETERFHGMSSYPRQCECGECGEKARLIIRPTSIMFSVDKTSERGFDYGAGRAFSSQSQRKDWMKANRWREVTPEEWAPYKQQLEDRRDQQIEENPAVRPQIEAARAKERRIAKTGVLQPGD